MDQSSLDSGFTFDELPDLPLEQARKVNWKNLIDAFSNSTKEVAALKDARWKCLKSKLVEAGLFSESVQMPVWSAPRSSSGHSSCIRHSVCRFGDILSGVELTLWEGRREQGRVNGFPNMVPIFGHWFVEYDLDGRLKRSLKRDQSALVLGILLLPLLVAIDLKAGKTTTKALSQTEAMRRYCEQNPDDEDVRENKGSKALWKRMIEFSDLPISHPSVRNFMSARNKG